MNTYDDYSEIIEQAITRLELPAEPEGLFSPITYTLSGGGKRIRPVLTLACADACGCPPRDVTDGALSIEMFHNFTLLHDDVMDKADMRRGRPTVHIRWNEQTAILSGDAMLTFATMLLSRCAPQHLPAALALFNTTAMEVYCGQQLDMDFERRLDVTQDEYIEMIRLKTSVLLGCACKMGALLAGAPGHVADALYRYGELLGLAFQLRDDLLDTYGDPLLFGKRVGGDILNDKKTWLLITALAEDTTGTLEQIIVTGKPDDEDKIAAVKEIYDRLGIKERVEKLIAGYSARAVDALPSDGIKASSREFLKSLALKAVSRNH